MNTGKRLKCIGCFYFGLGRDGVAGTCRRHAPQFLPTDSSGLGMWPITYREDWCCEFVPELPEPDNGNDGEEESAQRP